MFRRLREEYRTPTSGPGRLLRAVVIALQDIAVTNSRRISVSTLGGVDDRALYFFYDLEICSITYDIATYLALAEFERRKRNLQSIHVVIVPGRRLEREPDGYDNIVGPAERRARVRNLVIPTLSLLPSCKGFTVCESRGQAEAIYRQFAKSVFPEDYRPGFPIAPEGKELRIRAANGEAVFPMLQAARSDREAIRNFLDLRAKGRRVIVITLREYGYMEKRNSNFDSWLAFADGLDASRYAVVFVRDTSHAMEPLFPEGGRHFVCESASTNVGLRMALYESAYLNMAIMHGPMELCWYNELCRYLIFLRVGSAPQTDASVLRRNAFEIGNSLTFARDCQRWVWEPDDLSTIRKEFNSMTRFLEESPSPRKAGAVT